LQGVNDKKTPRDIRQLLKINEIQAKEYPAIKRTATNPAALAQVGMMGFTVGRDVAAINTDAFQGDPAVLMGIDMTTSVLYTQGLIEAYTGKTVGRKVLGASIAIPAFLAPYAYYMAEGKGEYPVAVNAVIGAFIGSAALKEFFSRRRVNRRETEITQSLRTQPEH
jgi:hypothetical protein